MRLNSWTGTEDLLVSSLNCDRPLSSRIRSPETVMSTGGQITDSVRPYATCQSVTIALEPATTLPGKAAGYGPLRAVKV